MPDKFDDIVSKISDIGKDWHSSSIVKNAEINKKYIGKSIRDISVPAGEKAKSALILSAGPSISRYNVIQRIKDSNYRGSVIAVDGAMIACLKQGLIPDYIVTLDPHPTRMVRWFGDHEFEENAARDDYFSRQDLDVNFRDNTIKENKKNIELVNKYGKEIKLIVCSTAPENLVERAIESGMDMYWWNPLMDDPAEADSLTRKLYSVNKLPCFNTGGTVGTASWVFTDSILGIQNIGLTGMDLGYNIDLPIEMTQTYYELQQFLTSDDKIAELFRHFEFPLTKEKFYTDPTYFWYRRNLLELLEQSGGQVYNCTEGGTLFGEGIICITLDEFLSKN